MTATITSMPPDVHTVSTYYDVIARVIEHFEHKVPGYERAQDYYKGNIQEIFANERIAEILEASGNDYALNFAGRVVDNVVDRLSIQSVQVSPAEVSDDYVNPSLEYSATGEMGDAAPVLSSGPDATELMQGLPRARNAITGHPADGTGDDPIELPAHDAAPATPPLRTADALQQTWARIYKANCLAQFFPRWIKKAEINGDGYAMLWDNGNDEQPGLFMEVMDPKTTCVLYDEENESIEVCSARWFETHDNRKRMNLYFDDWIVKLITKPKAAGDKPEDYIPFIDPKDSLLTSANDTDESPASNELLAGYPFINNAIPSGPNGNPPLAIAAALATQRTLATPLGQPQGNPNNTDMLTAHAMLAVTPDNWPVPNPYGFQPIHHLKTSDDECYGEPEHIDAYGPQNGINKLAATLFNTTDAQGFPSRFALQKSGTIDENAFDEDEDEELPPDHAVSSIDDEPGVVNILKDIDQLIQLAPSDPDAFLKPMADVIKFMSFVTSTPMSFYDTLGQMPSDSTQRENTGPLIQKCNKRKLVMTPTIERFVRNCFLVLLDRNVDVVVQWAQSQVVNDVAGWQVITGKIANGVPWAVAMQEAGYTEAQIASWPPPSNGFTARVNMALQIAQAAQALAAAANPAAPAQPAQSQPADPLNPEQAPTAAPAPAPKPEAVISPADAAKLIKTMIDALYSTPIDASSRTNVSFRG